MRRAILAGHTAQDVAAFIRQTYPNHDAGRLLLAAGESILNAADMPAKQARAWCICAAQEVYRKMLEVGDFAGALKAIATIHTMTRPPKTTAPEPPPLTLDI